MVDRWVEKNMINICLFPKKRYDRQIGGYGRFTG